MRHLTWILALAVLSCRGDDPGSITGDTDRPAGDPIANGDMAPLPGDRATSGDLTPVGDPVAQGDPVPAGDETAPGDHVPPGDETPPIDPPYWQETFDGKTVADLVSLLGWTVVELDAPTAGAAWEIGDENPDDFLAYNLDGDFLFADTSAFGIPTESMHARIATPLINLDEDPTLEFDYFDTGSGDVTDVLFSTDGSAWTSTSTLGCTVGTALARETFSCDLTTVANGSIHVGFLYQGASNASWHIDNVLLR